MNRLQHSKKREFFADGYSKAIDELRKGATEGKQWIAELQTQEQERSGIPSLKVKV